MQGLYPKALKFGDRQWIPDSKASHCMICEKPFIMFTRRRHHCRQCGIIVCHACSPGLVKMLVEYGNKAVVKSVRVCNNCERWKPNTASAIPSMMKNSGNAAGVLEKGDAKNKIIYKTRTVCAKCAVVEGKGFDSSIPAAVVVRNNKQVCLVATCPRHMEFSTVLSTNPSFFQSQLEYVKDDARSGGVGGDIEDLATLNAKMKLTSKSDNHPFMFEVGVFENGEFVKRSRLHRQLSEFHRSKPPELNYVLQFNCGLVPKHEIAKLNRLLLDLEHEFKGPPGPSMIVVNMPFDRMIDLASLDNTVLLKSRVYPSVKYFLVASKEDDYIVELDQLVAALSDISDIRLIIDLVLEQPMPDLTQIMAWLAKNRSMIPVVVLTMVRSPTEVYRRMVSEQEEEEEEESSANEAGEGGRATSSNTSTNTSAGVDAEKLLYAISKATKGRITANDMIPLRALGALEPLLRVMGHGRYSIRPHASCGFGTCLISTKTTTSSPVSRFFNMKKLYKQIRAFGSKIGPAQTINLAILRELRSALKASALPQASSDVAAMIDLLKLNGPPSTESIKDFQFMLVHTHMDFASIDASRRCECAVLTPALTGTGFTAGCTRCF